MDQDEADKKRKAAPVCIDLVSDDEEEVEVLKVPRVVGRVRIIAGGNILDAEEKWIVHQSNCQSKGARGLARALFDRYPEANVYRRRRRHSEPGSIDITQIRGKEQFVVALFAQRSPGKKYSAADTPAYRLEWFVSCLQKLGAALKGDHTTIAMPYNIGCGLAGGKWHEYKPLIISFAQQFSIDVHLYDLNNQAPPSELS